MIKLNSIVKDSATNLKGLVDMLHIEIGGEQTYRFHPSGLNPKTKEPLDSVWAKEQRLIGGDRVNMPVLPFEVLGTEVQDIGTGFKGMAVSLVLHASGCIHFNVQAKGQQENGNAIPLQNFSSLRLKGKAIKPLSEKAKDEERATKPSPGHHSMPPRLG